MENKDSKISKNFIIKIIVTLLIVVGIVYGGYQYYLLSEDYKDAKIGFSETKQEFESEIGNLKSEIKNLKRDNSLLSEALQNEREKNEAFQNTIEDITDELNKYEKLNEIDPEILKKYSKVYFLSEHYVPSSLTLIEKRYLYNEDDPEQIHTKVKPFITDMLDEARRDGLELHIKSAYRSFGIQSSLKSQYKVVYGQGTANSFSAEQGYSEHQLGTTVDLTTPSINGSLEGFENTEGFQWMQQNAHDYGFILSYPKNNGYYIYEPWHWRFVGKELARYLERNNINFYDMDQRKIDEYLINVFDK